MPKIKTASRKNPSKFIAFFYIAFVTASILFLASKLVAFNGDTKNQASVLADASAQFTVAEPAAVANQDGNAVTVGSQKAWMGNGESATNSYLGLFFSGANVPANATVKSATLEVTAEGGWISTGLSIYGDSSSKGYFTQNEKLSDRSMTAAHADYTENVKWEANKAYTYDVTAPVKELVGTTGKSTLSLLVKGTGGKYGRKNIFGAPSTGKSAKLTVAYTSTVQATNQPTTAPTTRPTTVPTTVPSAVPTVRPTTAPSPVASPTMDPGMPMPSSSPISTTPGSYSHAMTAWSWTGKNKPNTLYDKCDDGTDIVLAHQAFNVQGPDGLVYPTWHAPVVTNPITGKGKCYFGHEHGRDPKGFQYFDEVKQQFAYDANKNGQIEASELAKAGIPFAYVNEQIENYMAAKGGTTFMRHEDHVGHKIEFTNGEGDIGEGTDPFDSSKTGGVVVPVKTVTGNPKWQQSGVRCYSFDKIHQGVSTPDALSNNMHEAILYSKCVSSLKQYPSSTILLSGMISFGKPGQFLEFCNDNGRNLVVNTGLNADTMNLPAGRADSFRNIITRACVERTVLVGQGTFSSFPYEDWSGALSITTAGGKVLASKLGAWEVLDAIRYYNPASATKISYVSDLCTENWNGRTTHGGPCDIQTNYGKIRDILWTDPRSAFRGVHRGQYINAPIIDNAGGSQYVYTDPFGGNASNAPFAGSIRQLISPVKANLEGVNIDNRIIQRQNDDGGGTVHAPN